MEKTVVGLPIYKLEEVLKKVGRDGTALKKLEWALAGITDMWENGDLQSSALTLRNLKGQGLPSNKGTVDLMLFKMAIRDVALSEWLEESPLSGTHKDIIKQAFKDHKAFREHFGTTENKATFDTSWLSALPPGAILFVDFLESLCFSAKKDRSVKTVLCAGARPADVPDREEFSGDFKAFGEEWQKMRLASGEENDSVGQAPQGEEDGQGYQRNDQPIISTNQNEDEEL